MLEAISVQQHLLPPVIFLAMLTIGMELRISYFRELFRTPAIPVLASLIHGLAFPASVIALILLLQWLKVPVSDTIVLGVLLIAACPSGGTSNILAMMARVNLTLSITLTVVSSLMSFLSLPLLVASFGLLVPALQGPVSVPIGSTLLQLAVIIFIPVISGMYLSERFVWLTDDRIKKLQNGAQIVLFTVIALVIIESRDVLAEGLADAVPWSIGICLGNILVCYATGRAVKLSIENSITTALEGSVRNVSISFLIAANVLGRMDVAVVSVVYLITSTALSMLFAKNWRRIPGFMPQSAG